MRAITLVALVAILASPALADIYRYTDADGTVHFTNNPRDVPAESTTITQGPRLFACDNLPGAKCFAPGDPKYMTVRLRDRVQGDSRYTIKDPGSGVAVTVLEKAEDNIGQPWVKVDAGHGREGWVAEHFVRQRVQ